MTEVCATCKKPLGTFLQQDLFGGLPKCIQCISNDRAKMMLDCLPDDVDLEWQSLSDFEQSFLTSVRSQFEKKGTLSDKQYQVLERIWEKH